MKTRQKIKKEENWIRGLKKEGIAKENAASRAWERMMDYYLMNDFLEGNNHVEIIMYIYSTKHYANETIYCMSWKNCVGERTLYRYRKKYILCFKRYYEYETEKENVQLNSNLVN